MGHDLEEGCGDFDPLLALIPLSHAASYESGGVCSRIFDGTVADGVCSEDKEVMSKPAKNPG